MSPPWPGLAGARILRRGGERAAALDRRPRSRRVLLAALPMALSRRFDAAAAGELDAVLQLDVTDPRGGSPTPFTLTIGSERCGVAPGSSAAAGAVVAIAAGDMIRLASRSVGWPELMATGRLALRGDPFLALRFPALFGLSAAR